LSSEYFGGQKLVLTFCRLAQAGIFEKQINQVNSKHQRTSQRNVARKPRLRKTAVGLCAFINYVSNFA
jgi:hypothetical protein